MNGLTASLMGEALNYSRMAVNSKEHLLRVSNRDKGCLDGVMGRVILEVSIEDIFKEEECK